MDSSWLGLAEPLLVFGGLVAFMHWQFRELRQRAAAREKATQHEAHAPAPDARSAGSDEAPRHPPG